jgi:hypothetical protein
MRRVFPFLTVLGLAAATLTSARAQSWADQLIPERAFDAGTVARGSKVRHTFRLVNRTDQEVHIASWQTKCGCTEVNVGSRSVPPGTQTTIEAVLDTTRFLGYKPSGLTLVLDRPSYASVEINLSCFIRGDINLNPGVVDFGIVPRSSNPKPTVSLSLTYSGGQANWGITRMQTRSPRVSAKLQEQGRSGGGQVQYLLTATLDPTDISGYFKDEISLYTNDPGGQPIPVAVSGAVQSAVTVSPSPLVVGQIKAGQSINRVLMVRSQQPFKLSSVHSTRDELTAKTDSDEAKPVHTVNLTLKAPTQPGPYNAALEIATDVSGEPPLKVTTFATIVP